MNLVEPLMDLAGAAWRVLLRLPFLPVALLMVGLAAGAYVYREHVTARAGAQQQATLQARILADHTARSLGAVKLMMGAAGARIDILITEADRNQRPSEDNLQRTLQDVTAGQPLVRSLSVLREDGSVKASSQAGNIGIQVPASLFRPHRETTGVEVQMAAGRDLADASPDLTQASKRQLLVMTQAMPQSDGRGQLWLVAALNPEFFATQHLLMLDSPSWRSAVLTLDRRVLAATLNHPADPGSVLPDTPDARAGEYGLLRTNGADGIETLGAWRLTREFPLRVEVDLPMAEAMAAWKTEARRVGLGALLLAGAVVGLGAAARRHLRARERAEADGLRARAELREHYEMTEQLVDAMAVPLFLTDLDGNLLLANRAWTSLMGFDREPWSESAAAERDRRVRRLLEQGIQDVAAQRRVEWPMDLPGADGVLREIVVTKVALLGDSGQVRGVIGTAVDVTEYKQVVRATESARQAAEAANRSRTEFVANITHELRTPLQSILGFAELGIGRAEGQEKLKLMFDRVHQAGGRMLRLVDELLDLSRIGSSVGSIELRMSPLAGPLREVVDELRHIALKRGLTLKLEVDPSLHGVECNIDPGRLQQVARNVLANALRFAPAGTAIEFDLRPQDGFAVASVTDYGPGIPEAERESIFEPFVQSSQTKDGSGGTGLGLAICRQIMKAHDGFIDAGNHVLGGAVFRFGVPLAGTAARAPEDGQPEKRGEAEAVA